MTRSSAVRASLLATCSTPCLTSPLPQLGEATVSLQERSRRTARPAPGTAIVGGTPGDRSRASITMPGASRPEPPVHGWGTWKSKIAAEAKSSRDIGRGAGNRTRSLAISIAAGKC